MRGENRRWRNEALAISEVCVIIQNILVTLLQSDRSDTDGDDYISGECTKTTLKVSPGPILISMEMETQENL